MTRTFVTRSFAAAGLAMVLLGCTEHRPPVVVRPADAADAPASDGGADELDAPLFPDFALPEAGERPACTPGTCEKDSYRYCGKIGDGCGNNIECGPCPGALVCGGGGIAGICGGGPTCVPSSCDSPGGRLCGSIGNGCGGPLNCGECPLGQTCGGAGVANVCAPDPATCTPRTCDSAGGKFCGNIGDGCGKPLACGDCPAGQVCGGAGTPNVCAPDPATCTPLTCATATGRYCGTIGDGCGKTLTCGDCPAGQGCGAAGRAGVCAPLPGTCTPTACQQATGKYCGTIGNGCGGMVDCMGCAGIDTCGGSGVTSVCGNPAGRCTNLCLRQVMCPGGGATVVTGTVLAPTPPAFGPPDPIYNAIVYVPNAPVEPFKPNVACEQCGAQVTGQPLVAAHSAFDGTFRLTNVPAGDNVPLVIQLGRWRRQVVIPRVEPCGTTALPAELTRFPRNKAEGDIPKTAIATGQVDTLECVLRKMGIDDAEFTHPSGDGRIHLYRATAQPGASAPGPTGQWTYDQLVGAPTGGTGTNRLSQYDMVVLPCQGAQIHKDSVQVNNLRDYANAGGRIFATHYSYAWLYNTQGNGTPPYPFQGTANWRVGGTGAIVDAPRPPSPFTATIDQSFARGAAFAQWMLNLGASPTLGLVSINDGRHNVNSVVPPSQRWVHGTNANASNSPTLQHYTFDTEIGKPAAQQCGRVLFSNFHVANISDASGFTFPAQCSNTGLNAQERALEFMFFDLASCVQPYTPPPPPPPPPPAPPAIPPVPPAIPPAPPPAPPMMPPPPPPPPPVVVQ